jgi:cytochrome P450
MTAPALPITRSCPFSPEAEHVRLRDEAAVVRVTLPGGSLAWAVSRLDHIRTMLTDPRFSSDRMHPNFPILLDVRRSPDARRGRPMLIAMDPPEHTTARRAVVGEFTVKRMAALRPRIQQIVDEHIDALLAGPHPADLVPALSQPVPSLVICELLGVPYRDHEFFQGQTGTLLRRTTSPEQREEAATAIREYMADLVDRKAREPGDDLLSRQLARGADREDLVSLGFLLLIAGHETTANMISLGTLALLDNPDQLALLRADPARTPGAVEELLRYFTIAEFATSRVAAEDVEIGGAHIRAGDGVIVLGNAANRDPAAFPDADELDITRGARHHIAFGFGAHQCLGQNLARMELEIVFDTLFRRIPGLRLATPVAQLPFKDDASIYGLYELPVTWEA